MSALRPSSSSCNCFLYCLLIRHFGYVLSVLIFHSKIVLFLLHPVFDLLLCILLRHVNWTYFRYFGRSWFLCVALPCPVLFWASILSPISFDLFLLVTLYFSVVILVCTSHYGLVCFPFPVSFACSRNFRCPSSLIIIIIITIKIIINIIVIIYSFRVFHISVTWWFFTGVWVTASLLKSPGLFSVFWPFSIILSFGWSLLVLQLPSPQSLK